MKYLSEYMEDRQTKAFEKAGSFFAFGDKQFKEAKEKHNYTDKNQLVSLGVGMICPKDTAEDLLKELETIYKESIAQDIAENGIENCIKRELNNHEAYYTRDTESTAEALSDYPNATAENIGKIFRNKNYKIAV